jgi:hypothetical protein
MVLGMEIKNREIAEVACCSEGAVRAASSAGKLVAEDLESVLGFCLAMRIKKLGLCGLDDVLLIDKMVEGQTRAQEHAEVRVIPMSEDEWGA